MCCFSRPVRSVRDTLSADEDLAMVLPLPVPPGSPEDAVRFVDLSGCPSLFEALAIGFLPPEPPQLHLRMTKSASPPPPPLEVVRVGSFVASFVPTVADFARLDPRFQLPEGTWDELPDYQDHGFVVVALGSGQQALHPMALEFPRRDPHKLFFPTVHIHDGEVHPQARFDHALYLQEARGERLPLHDWEESRRPARHYLDPASTGGLVLPEGHVYRRRMSGYFPNADTYV
jgi:hypothetical protein